MKKFSRLFKKPQVLNHFIVPRPFQAQIHVSKKMDYDAHLLVRNSSSWLMDTFLSIDIKRRENDMTDTKLHDQYSTLFIQHKRNAFTF